MLRISIVIAIVLVVGLLLLTRGGSSIERKLLFFPTHRSDHNGLTPWMNNGETIGYARSVPTPGNVWLLFHGNAGQAADRTYALPSFSPKDSVFILEYPGYGTRAGAPSTESFNRAAREAYLLLRETYPRNPVCVVGESIGSGPACSLARLTGPPDKFVLIAPFDLLSSVAKDHFPAFLVGLLLHDDWDNVAALSNYRGPVAIFGAKNDTIIPVAHARALAAAVPSSTLTLIEGGHNDWSHQGPVRIGNP